MKRNRTLAVLLAVALVAIVGAVPAFAYFTANDSAVGSIEISIPPIRTEINEDVDDFTKTVSIASDEGSAPAYLRVAAYAGAQFELTIESADGTWTDGGDGWWYCNDILEGGQSTGEITVTITDPTGNVDLEEFNVVVIHEATPVFYDEAGEPYAQWGIAYEVEGAE